MNVAAGDLYVIDGLMLTSAGGAAGIDLCLHIIRTDHGSSIANDVARRCVTAPWRDGGQTQYIERAVRVEDLGDTAKRAVGHSNICAPCEASTNSPSTRT